MGNKGAIAAVAVGAYAVIAFVLVKTPLLYPGWKKRFEDRFPYSMANVAHRGGSLTGPENTIFAFTRALKEGSADMLELDVWASKDGQAVVSHDDTLGRTCGSTYEHVAIADIVVGSDPSETLPQTHRSIPLHFIAEGMSRYDAPESVPRDDTTRACLLSEVFERFPGIPMHVDIKDTSYDFVCTVINMIERYGREQITFVGSSNTKNKVNIKRFFAECSHERRRRFRVFANTREYLISHLYFYLGIMPFVKLDYDVFSIPVWTSTMWRGAVDEYGLITTIVGAYLMTSPVMWSHMRRRGIAVLGWVLNAEKDFAEAARWPLDGVITDNPILYREFLVREAKKKGTTPSQRVGSLDSA